MIQSDSRQGGLRERKKLRTRETITRAALDLFSERGYHATTLAQIADAAEIAPSTLHAYFPSKDDILFSLHDAIRASVRKRVVHRAGTEPVIDALLAWVTETLPQLARADTEQSLRQRRAIIESSQPLRDQERLRYALLEDDFAEAFASEMAESPNDLRSRLMASVTTHGLLTVWHWWYPQQAQGQLDPRELSKLDTTYLMGVISAAERVLETSTSPPLRPHAPGTPSAGLE